MIETAVVVDGLRLEVARWPATEAAGHWPIVLLHEGLGSVRLWKDFPARLTAATGREVIAWSRQGHGWSAFASDTHDCDYMHREAEALPAVLDALGIERAHWLGHSDGGSIALIAAGRPAARAASLILLAPHVVVQDLTVRSIARMAKGFATSGLAERMQRYHDDPVRMYARWRDIWLRPAFRDWTIEAALAGIRVPVLLVQGRDDEYGTMAQLERIEAFVDDATRLELDKCGHSPHFDRADAVIEAVVGFLQSKD